jgi:hypothetical protein
MESIEREAMFKRFLVSLSKMHSHLLGFSNQGSLCVSNVGSDLACEGVSVPPVSLSTLENHLLAWVA